MAFYGRWSTEDNQDPESSREWQVGNARKLVEPMDDQVVGEFSTSGSRGRLWVLEPCHLMRQSWATSAKRSRRPGPAA